MQEVYWVKGLINQIKKNNSCSNKQQLNKNSKSNNGYQLLVDQTMPLLPESTANNDCIIVDIQPQPNMPSIADAIVTINAQEKAIAQKKQTTSKLVNYGTIL